MESRAKVLGHPLHQMLIVLPLGLLIGAVAFDVIRFVTGNPFFSEMAYYLVAAGITTGLLAAIPGAIDYFAIPGGTRAKYIGTLHAVGNVIVLALFAASWLLRDPAPRDPAGTAYLFSFLGFALAGVTGWLGGELVDRLGIGVDEGAHVNAPSSLSGMPASGDRSGMAGGGYRGPERRHNAMPAYAGIERRRDTMAAGRA